MSGCVCHQPVGEPVDDPAKRAALLQACRRPDVHRAVFRTLIHWPGREISLVEIVKALPDGGFAVVGMADVGNTLYAVQIDSAGQGRVVSKSLPFSDQWLLDGIVAELLIPWNGPDEASQLFRLSDGTWALKHEEDRVVRMFLFDETGRWQELRRLSGCRLRRQAFLEWDGGSVPAVMRVENFAKHYRAVRETVSSE